VEERRHGIDLARHLLRGPLRDPRDPQLLQESRCWRLCNRARGVLSRAAADPRTPWPRRESRRIRRPQRPPERRGGRRNPELAGAAESGEAGGARRARRRASVARGSGRGRLDGGVGELWGGRFWRAVIREYNAVEIVGEGGGREWRKGDGEEVSRRPGRARAGRGRGGKRREGASIWEAKGDAGAAASPRDGEGDDAARRTAARGGARDGEGELPMRDCPFCPSGGADSRRSPRRTHASVDKTCFFR